MGWIARYGTASTLPAYRQKLQINTTSLPSQDAGVAYSVAFQAQGGIQPYNWSVVSFTPNTGGQLSLSVQGVLSGTPNTAETETISVRLSDASGTSSIVSAPISFTIFPALVITSSSPLPPATSGQAYSFTFQASGGAPPYTWSSTPIGIFSLDPNTGVFSGTPIVAGPFSATFTVKDSTGNAVSKLFTLNITTGSQSYVADAFISPTGDDVTGDGSFNKPWSMGALNRADGVGPVLSNGSQAWHQLGVLPGFYNGSVASGALTKIGDFINANGAAPYILTAGGGVGNPRVIFSCDANGNYSPRTAVWDAGTANPYFTTNNPLRQGAILGLGNQPHLRVDGIIGQNGSTNGISSGTGIDVQILNCDIGNNVSPENGTNPSLISFSPGADAIYLYNSSFHDATLLMNTPVTLTVTTGVPSTSGTLTAVNGVSTAVTGWPFDSTSANGNVGTLTFTDSHQTISPTFTHGSNTVTWASTTLSATSGAATASMGSAKNPHDIWGIYMEGVGLTTPVLIESCAFRRTGQNGIKTTPGNASAKYSWFEALDFGVFEAGAAQYAFTQPGPQTGISVTFDHCIFVGAFLGVDQGSTNNSNSVRGTLNFTHNTIFTVAGGGGGGWIMAIAQDSPPTINTSNNLFAAYSGGWALWAAAGGSNFGTVNTQNNVFLNGQDGPPASLIFRRTNTPAGSPISANGGTTYTLSQIKSALGYETGSITLAGVTPFTVTPAKGYPESFATNGTAVIAGITCGAIDGTVGANGVPNGPNFLSFIGTNALGTAKVGSAYSGQITATGGSGNYTYTLSASPNWLLWLSINPSTGALSGTPPMPGTETVTINAVCNVTQRAGTALVQLTVLHQ